MKLKKIVCPIIKFFSGFLFILTLIFSSSIQFCAHPWPLRLWRLTPPLGDVFAALTPPLPCLASALCAVYCDICDASTRGQMEKNQGQADTKPTWANKISKELIKFSRKFISINCTSLPPSPVIPPPGIVCARQQTVCRPVSGKLPPFPNLIYLLHLPTLQELYLLFIVLYIIYFFHNHCFQYAQNN